ncbi:MAG: hypothetical protein HUN04_10175 [Desulfobacter sp.]|nr:MAG: hypothetical protein HUN04_10175 [Desulfobacter sp.]
MLFAALAIVLFTGIIGSITWFNEIQGLEKRFDEIEKSYSDVIRRTLWVDDKENLQVILMGICRLPGIEYADIHGKNDMVCMAGKRVAHKKLARVFPIVQAYNGKEYTLGHLHVIGSLDYVHQKIVKAVISTAVSQASIILMVCLLVLFLIYRIVIGRLIKITDYASSLSLDSLGMPLGMTPEKGSADELNHLADAINYMQANLYHAFTRQKEVEDKLKQHRENLEKLVAQRTSSLNLTNEKLRVEIDERKKIETEREKVIADLKQALAEIKTLRGIIPICANCKKIRDDQGYWEKIEVYIEEHSNADFSHGLCPKCADEIYGDQDWYIEMKKDQNKED